MFVGWQLTPPERWSCCMSDSNSTLVQKMKIEDLLTVITKNDWFNTFTLYAFYIALDDF